MLFIQHKTIPPKYNCPPTTLIVSNLKDKPSPILAFLAKPNLCPIKSPTVPISGGYIPLKLISQFPLEFAQEISKQVEINLENLIPPQRETYSR
jgi:hypothetical protein